MKKHCLIYSLTTLIFTGCNSTKNVSEQSPESTISGAIFKANYNTGATFYWQLHGNINLNINAEIYDIDLEDNTRSGLIQKLKSSGKKVICYMSAGSFENWRMDAKEFPRQVLGKTLDGWPDERWLDIRNTKVREIMAKRMDLAASSGCEGVEPDNTDGYANDNGFNLTEEDTIEYLNWFSKMAHSKGLSVGLKNTTDLIAKGKLHKKFDWALNEQCYEFRECATLKPFVDEGKAVFIAEYKSKKQSQCNDAKSNGFTLAFYNLSLDGSKFQPCR